MKKAIYVVPVLALLIAQIAVAVAEGGVLIGVAIHHGYPPYAVAIGSDKAIYIYRYYFAKIWPNGTAEWVKTINPDVGNCKTNFDLMAIGSSGIYLLTNYLGENNTYFVVLMKLGFDGSVN